ncbi:MAG: hypothetical protein CMG00_03155 [Candidatus Marinimicrobia bacterium]|nr:hypothetical protein [Candidatus Neomarinimicrobiota bacterium]|tara:strand:- start:788 stop:1591 length:804 start_codon:yes stop_codon:yes gene_type:complete
MIFLIILTITGLCYGSFINVLIYRIPKNISIIKPRSFCTTCKSKIPIFRNIPLVSFIIQKGMCYNCNQKISFRYPLIELLTGLLWLLLALNGLEKITAESIANTLFSIVMVSFLIPLAIIDYKHLYFPSNLIVPLIIYSFTHSIYIYLYNGNSEAFFSILYSLSFLCSTYLLTKLYLTIKKRYEQPLGFGDFLLIIPLAIWTGALGILLCIFISSILGLLIWLLLHFFKGYDLKKRMPFGPFLIISAILIKLTNITNLISALIFQTI